MEIEITAITPLTPEQLALVQAHSLWNGYNVYRDELCQLGRQLGGDPALLATGIQACERRVSRLADRQATLADAAQLDDLEITVDAEIEKIMHRTPKLGRDPAVICAQANLRSLSWILRVRARELLARAAGDGTGAAWHSFTVAELEDDFHEFVRALADNARGEYRFVGNLALQQPGDYYLNLKFEGGRGTSLLMPVVFKDVLRDLIANARKYTAPGGQIQAAVHSGAEGLRLVVQDTGRGIPADQIQTVVEPGLRGRNVADRRTMGGGYGLTKAFWVTKQFGGRFWIDSEEGRGTKVRLWIPPGPAAG